MTDSKTLAIVSRILDEAVDFAYNGVSSFEYNRISNEEEAEAVCRACSGFAKVTFTKRNEGSPTVKVFTFHVNLVG